MAPPTLTPAEQIRRFVDKHPGEWRQVSRRNYDGAMALQTTVGWLVLRPFSHSVSVTASYRGFDDHEFYATDDEESLPILAQAAARIAEVCQEYTLPAEGLPPWLAGPVRHQLINRARTLLTSAGISPADAVMAAETLDEHLLTRPPVEPTFSAVVNTLLEIGMSCRWVKDPAEPVEMT